MGRTKGSKNRNTLELEKLQQRIDELEKQNCTYDEVLETFSEGFVMDLFDKDIIKTISYETLQTWFSNPDTYIQEINNLLNYYYISNGDIFQLYDLIFSLPKLNYKIKAFEKNENYEKDLVLINKFLQNKVNHKELTRDMLIQLISSGTVICTWIGKKEPYLYIFDNLEYIYPYQRYKGKLQAVIDLSWLDNKSDEERESIINNLSPLITQKKYEEYLNNNDKKLVKLPIDKTIILRNHTLRRNQRLGLPSGTQTIFNILHKQKLKDLEVAIANKIIRAVALLKFKGKDDNDITVKESQKRKVYQSVKSALQKNSKNDGGITCLGIPDFASFEFPKIENGDKILDPKKYDSINFDSSTSIGISPVLTSGMLGNYASAKLNLDMLYTKIGVLLEQIEEVYQQLFKIVLGDRADNYRIIYDKDAPLTKKEKIDILMKLHNEGYSVKHVVDLIDDVDYEEYIEQSTYEIEDLKLRDKIIPPKTSYTLTDKGNEAGTPTQDDSTEESTIQDKTNGGNGTPRASI
ncbi:hypothetical protein [Clostridium sporogenes]|uniref:hypothetical protein n=1 Tax=Clostridium sporogenes TaxID=1509 RepID=UPI0013D68ACE|nr:hypothetical protein [Clostridium sporogenes]NFH40690.1 hypothetical protein [Clostridium sporogenes]